MHEQLIINANFIQILPDVNDPVEEDQEKSAWFLTHLPNSGQYIFSIVQDGKDPLVELSWDKETSYNLKVHGTCKGSTTGMCGAWNGKAKDDMTMPDGVVTDR